MATLRRRIAVRRRAARAVIRPRIAARRHLAGRGGVELPAGGGFAKGANVSGQEL